MPAVRHGAPRPREFSKVTSLFAVAACKGEETRYAIGMNIELSTLEERAEAEECLAEALRILNASIRRVHNSGLLVQAEVLTMRTQHGTVPQINLGTLDRQHGAI